MTTVNLRMRYFSVYIKGFLIVETLEKDMTEKKHLLKVCGPDAIINVLVNILIAIFGLIELCFNSSIE